MLVLGIESSCDETAAAVVRDDGTVLSDVIASQEAVHARFRGVVPELASRAHLRNVVPVVSGALAVLPNGLADVDAVAVTNGPGLAGALLVGVQLAKALALVTGKPLVGVDHLVAHLLAARLGFGGAAPPDVPFPYVGLLVSGGHTATYEVRSPLDVELVAQTRDDAAGEAFDKVAKLVGLGYPGGPLVDALAHEGDPTRVKLPRPMASRASLDMSFSGLKTAVARHVAEHGVPEGDALADLCAAFQDVVVRTLVQKSLAACEARGLTRLVLAGGVARNAGLRAHAARACAKAGVTLHLPEPAACTDNAAMIAYAGAQRLVAGQRDDATLPIYSRSPTTRRGKIREAR